MKTLSVRQDFPALGQKIREMPLVYLDHAATALKPRAVIEAIKHFYEFETANVHRGAHYLSNQATEKFENVREAVRQFVNADDSSEIIFTSGTTDSINLVAHSWGLNNLSAGDEIILSEMEHHANIVPWQHVAKLTKAKIHWVAVNNQGELDFADYMKKLSPRTKIVSLVHASNAIGTVNPLKIFFTEAKKVGALTLADVAQSVGFLNLDVKALGCDFLAFSAHKLYGPYGVGVLFARLDILNKMLPYRLGGSMISTVTKSESTYLEAPHRFEAGTPNIAGVIGLGAAIEYVNSIGLPQIEIHEKHLVTQLLSGLKQIGGMQILGDSPSRTSLVSFNIAGVHAADIGQILDQQGIAVRVGHHCNQPLMSRFNVSGTVRVSFGVYNSTEDVDIAIKGIKKAAEMLK